MSAWDGCEDHHFAHVNLNTYALTAEFRIMDMIGEELAHKDNLLKVWLWLAEKSLKVWLLAWSLPIFERGNASHPSK